MNLNKFIRKHVIPNSLYLILIHFDNELEFIHFNSILRGNNNKIFTGNIY